MRNNFLPGYNQIVSEHFDLDDNETLRIITAVDEADQGRVLESLTSKLYDLIVKKVDDIDFGSIPRSKGDITQIENYDQLIECCTVIKGIVVEFKQDSTPIDSIITAIDNVKSRKDLWEKAFSMNCELPTVFYNTIVLSIVSSVSFMIASSIEFIKSPAESFQVSLDKVAYNKTKNNLLYKNIGDFNKSCDKGDVDKAISHVMDTVAKTGGTAHNKSSFAVVPVIGGAIAVIAISISIVPILRELIYFFYHAKQSLADFFEMQANLLQLNADSLQYQAGNDKEKKEIAKKQMKVVEKFRKASDVLQVKVKKAESDSIKDIAGDNKKYKIDDVMESIPDSATPNPSIF